MNREEWDRLVEAYEWLEDHCWPTADLTITPRLPTPAEADNMLARDLADGLREWNEKHGRTPAPTASPKLTANELREMSKLAVKWAEEDALTMLAAKARQVAALPRLVIDHATIKPRQA